MRLLEGSFRAGAVRSVGAAVATLAVACCATASPASGAIRTIRVGAQPWGVSADGTHVWVANKSDETISEIEASSGTVIRTIPVAGLYERDEHPGGDVSSDGSHVWVTNAGEEAVSEIDASTGDLVRTIPVAGRPFGVSADGADAWVTGGGAVSEIDASSGAIVRTIPVGGNTWAVSSDGTDTWVTDTGEAFGEEMLREIDAGSGAVIGTINAGEGPSGISSDGAHVWVTNPYEGTVREIDAASGVVIDTIPIGGHPWDVSSDGTHVWVTNFDGTVTELDAASGAVINTIQVGNPYDISSDGARVWVSDPLHNTVSEFPAGYPVGEPTARTISPRTGGTYPTGASAPTQFSCAEGEGGPGLESCTDSNGASDPAGALDTAATGPHTYTVTARSKDGQSSTASLAYNVVAPICAGNSGTIKLSPGLTNTPTVQTIKVKGTLTGCSGTPFAQAGYAATLRTSGPVSCAVLSATGETATGTAKYKWAPKAPASSGMLALTLTEALSVAFTGEVTAGSYAPRTLTETGTQSYAGGPTCGHPVGGKAAKAVKKGVFGD